MVPSVTRSSFCSHGAPLPQFKLGRPARAVGMCLLGCGRYSRPARPEGQTAAWRPRRYRPDCTRAKGRPIVLESSCVLLGEHVADLSASVIHGSEGARLVGVRRASLVPKQANYRHLSPCVDQELFPDRTCADMIWLALRGCWSTCEAVLALGQSRRVARATVSQPSIEPREPLSSLRLTRRRSFSTAALISHVTVKSSAWRTGERRCAQ